MEPIRGQGGTRWWCALALVALAFLAAPAAANADFSFGTGLQAKPANTAAGANSDFTLNIVFGGTDDVKDLTVELPPGQVGNPLATPKCTRSQLNVDNCPAKSQVGTTSAKVTIDGIPQPLTVDGSIYNLTPDPGEPAKFGIVLRPVGGLLGKVVLTSDVQLRNQPVGSADFGLNTIIKNIPNTSNGMPTHINSMTVTLMGKTKNGNAFMRNPTSCSQATTTFLADSYSNTSATGTASYTPGKCGSLNFSPTFSAALAMSGDTTPPTQPALTTVVDQDPGEADVRNASIVLPHGVGADTTTLTRQCSLAEFTAGTCPASTLVGTATARSPFLTTALSGPVSIVAPQTPGNLPRLGLDLQGALHIQLFGAFSLSAAGQGNAFMNLPDIPLSHFALTFKPNDLVAASRDLCSGGAPKFATSFAGWNGASRSGNVAAQVKGCGGGTSAKPKAKVAVTKAASKKPKLKLRIRDKAKVKKAKLELATGLRFAKGHRFHRGFHAKGAAVSHGRRSVSLKTRRGGARKLVAKAAKGALLRTKKIAGKKLRFKLTVVDASGKKTKLRLATRARH